MSSKLNRWLRSKTGLVTVSALLVLVLVVVVIFVYPGGLFGTPPAPPPVISFPAPAGGYTCLPTCVENDNHFLSLPGADLYSFNNWPTVVWFGVPAQYTQFNIQLFDGDSGMDDTGALNPGGGNWDTLTAEAVYTLYADPMKSGSKAVKVAEFRGNQLKMPNNKWYTISIPIDANAKKYALAPSGHYFFRLEATLENPTNQKGLSAFKIRSDAYLTSGQSDSPGATGFNAQIGLAAAWAGPKDRAIIYPQMVNVTNLGPSNYSGDWYFYFPVTKSQDYIEIWDGDFDFGSANSTSADSDDPNTAGKPAWAGPNTRDEAAQGMGNPADDNTVYPHLVRTGSVSYSILNPLGQPIYQDLEPSGTEEWEKFSMTSNATAHPDADLVVQGGFVPGFYTFKIQNLDIGNTVWLRLPLCDGKAGCGPTTTTGVCPRTIGYWKNNVEKVLIKQQTNGVQETPESLDRALQFLAQTSPLYRSGINLTTPAALPEPGARLTDQEAYTILMRGAQGVSYPGDSQTMLARALQQNLAAWLNMTSGKIGADTRVKLSRDGTNVIFEGSLWDALQTAQAIMLNPASTPQEMERAKDIGDLINNGLLGEDATADQTACDRIPPVTPTPPPQTPPPSATTTPIPTPTCSIPDFNLAKGYAIVALNEEACQGEQNGLLFHGTSGTYVTGSAFSNGCLRAVGTTNVQMTQGTVDYIGPNFGNMELIHPAPVQVPTKMTKPDWYVAPPNCSDPAAKNVSGKDWNKGDIFLTPGLYCVTGDVSINDKQKFIGSEVTIYFVDGRLTINGGATVQLTAPFPNGLSTIAPALPNILFYFPGESGAGQKVIINGNSTSYIEGVVYAPGSDVNFLGTGYTNAPYRSQIIGWNVEVGGTADLYINYQGSGQPTCTP